LSSDGVEGLSNIISSGAEEVVILKDDIEVNPVEFSLVNLRRIKGEINPFTNTRYYNYVKHPKTRR
jgi:hypothetical protein